MLLRQSLISACAGGTDEDDAANVPHQETAQGHAGPPRPGESVAGGKLARISHRVALWLAKGIVVNATLQGGTVDSKIVLGGKDAEHRAAAARFPTQHTESPA